MFASLLGLFFTTISKKFSIFFYYLYIFLIFAYNMLIINIILIIIYIYGDGFIMKNCFFFRFALSKSSLSRLVVFVSLTLQVVLVVTFVVVVVLSQVFCNFFFLFFLQNMHTLARNLIANESRASPTFNPSQGYPHTKFFLFSFFFLI